MQAALAMLLPLLASSALPTGSTPQPGEVLAIPSLHVPSYMGTWYQLAWFPNRFQKQCVSDTSAHYRQRDDGNITVLNRCKTADGRYESAVGLARPAGSHLENETLRPAQLEVSFLPAALRWLPVWGSYWVLELADDGRYAVIGEPTREYLWILARQPTLSQKDEARIRSLLEQRGYELSRWQAHSHSAGTATAP